MEILNQRKNEQIQNIEIEMEELQRTIQQLEEEELRLKQKEKQTKVVKNVRMNYQLNDNKYNYNQLKDESEKQQKKFRNFKAKIQIDQKWQIANMKKPNIKQFFKPQCQQYSNLQDDFGQEEQKILQDFQIEKDQIDQDKEIDEYMKNYYTTLNQLKLIQQFEKDDLIFIFSKQAWTNSYSRILYRYTSEKKSNSRS